MDVGAPLPEIAATDDTLLLTYCDPERARVRIVFTHPLVYYFGPPNDEALQCHPLAPFGLEPYATFEVSHARWIEALKAMNRGLPQHSDAMFDRYRHYIWTFHDNTFECLADGFALE